MSEMAEKYEIGQSKDDTDGEQKNPPKVILYYTYVSQSGVRTPTDISSVRDDTDLLDKVKDPNAEARRIELSQVVDVC